MNPQRVSPMVMFGVPEAPSPVKLFPPADDGQTHYVGDECPGGHADVAADDQPSLLDELDANDGWIAVPGEPVHPATLNAQFTTVDGVDDAGVHTVALNDEPAPEAPNAIEDVVPVKPKRAPGKP